MSQKFKNTENGKKLTISSKIGNIIYPKRFQGVVMSGSTQKSSENHFPNHISAKIGENVGMPTSAEILTKLDELNKSAEEINKKFDTINKAIEQRKSLPWLFKIFQ